MSDKARGLYEKLKADALRFDVLRMEPDYSSKDLADLVDMAAAAVDEANWLRAQRDTAEDELASVFPGSKWADAVARRTSAGRGAPNGESNG